MALVRDENATHNGKPAVRLESQMSMDLNVLGTPTQIKSRSVNWLDPVSGAPLALESRSESAGRVSTVKATFTADSVSYVAEVTGSVKKDTLRLKPGEKFLADTSGGLSKMPPVGSRFQGKVFVPEPAVLKLVDSEVIVESKEPINIGGQVVTAYKVQDKNPLAPSVVWMTETGELLRTDSILGMRMVKEPKEIALAPADKAADLMALVGIRPTGEKMENPRKTTFVRYEIAPVSRALPPDDTIQQTRVIPGSKGEKGETVEVTVSTRPLPESSDGQLFPVAMDAPERLRPFLQTTLYVQADKAAFQKLAKEIVGGEKDPAKVARKISDYVYNLMRPDPSISNLRTAEDILQTPRGVCRDYTLLYTTIARAAGLPTKQCIGIAYANGMFLGHAWPEVWVGEDKTTGKDLWVALEPTWGAPFADGTHIKLAEGELSDFYSVAADLGNYQIKVLEAR
ncbi:MAG: hypothetical protein OHK0029_30940 [Armatimonadaceae bacterium]